MSRYKVKEDVVKKMSDLLFEVLGKANRKEHFITTLFEILSPVERLMVGKRLLIMYMIFIGIEYDIICGVVKVSRSTIAKYSFLVDKSPSIKKTFSVQLMKNKFHNIFSQFILGLNEPSITIGSWKSANKLKKQINIKSERGF